MDLHVVRAPERRDQRLGRHVVHDPRSRSFQAPRRVDTTTWRTRTLRVYDPSPNPNQRIGDCTGVSECVMGNTAGNRVARRVLTMADADRIYSLATDLDPFDGSWPPDDTGSSGTAAAAAAKQLGYSGIYRWLFAGADQVVQMVIEGDPVSCGTWWYEGMMDLDSHGFIEPTGRTMGGHQWTVRGYNEPGDYIIGRCWWGEFRDFKLKREHLAALLAEDGDAHVTEPPTAA